jgi:hypothetical protein
MRARTANYFIGSLFSKQSIFAYGIAAAVTTAGQFLLVWGGLFSGIPQRTEAIPRFIELYIETVMPLWIPPITAWNIAIFLLNVLISIGILVNWTLNYDESY